MVTILTSDNAPCSVLCALMRNFHLLLNRCSQKHKCLKSGRYLSSYTLNTRLYMCSCDNLIKSMIQTYEQADQCSRADDQGLLFSGAWRSPSEWVQLLQRATPLFQNKDSCLSCSIELHTEAPAQCWQSTVEMRRFWVPAWSAESLCEGLKSCRRGVGDGSRPPDSVSVETERSRERAEERESKC